MDPSDNLPLHSAAESNNLEAAELLLREKINIYSKDKQGLTPLHIAIKKRLETFCLFQAKENKDYVCSFHDTLRRELEELKDADVTDPSKMYLNSYRETDRKNRKRFNKEKQDSLNAIRKKIKENDELMNLMLKYRSLNRNCKEDSTFLNFCTVCTLKNSSHAQRFSDNFRNINQAIDKNNSWYPGYSPLHFAAHCNADIVRILVTKGGNLLAQDVKGVTPLEICSKMFSVEEIQSIISLVPVWNNALFSDGKTRLIDYLLSLQKPESHKIFLQSLDKDIILSENSQIWPGWTILHMAVSLLKEPQREMISDILAQGADVTIQDSHGSTPVHLAFRQNKLRVLELLLKRHKKVVNPFDKDNLSHLHIVASVNERPLTLRILKKESAFDVPYRGESLPTVKSGWTPLHLAAYTNHAIIARSLIQKGANLLLKDAQGFTVVHRLLGNVYARKVAKSVFSSDHLEECVVENVGLTHLHVAAWMNDSVTINTLLDVGSDVEGTIGKLEDEQLKRFEGCRAIHVAMMDRTRVDAFSALLKRGADIFARRFDEPSPLVQVLTGKYDHNYVRSVVEWIWSSEKWQKIVEEKMGMTVLHVACYALDEVKINKLLKEKIDVNARMRDDSDLWPGFAPLHVLVGASLNLQHDKRSLDIATNLCDLLISKGADVTLADAEGNTPVLVALKTRVVENGNLRAMSLMKHHTDFSINPTNKFGMSHFHVACLLNEVNAAKGFLKHGTIDVNHTIDAKDNSRFAGHTPLLLALSPRAKKYYDSESQWQIVDLLLDRDADKHAVDAFGYTPLHKLLACATRNALLCKILIDNKDINSRTNDGKTPMEILLSEGASRDEVNFLVKRGSRINSYNPISDRGYMAILFTSSKYKSFFEVDKILQIMMDSPDIAEVTDTGRNAILNAVSSMKESRTALHLAVKFQNIEALRALLDCGADVNIVDSSDKSPFSYASEFRKDKRSWISTDSNAEVCRMLALHLRKLQLIGLQVSKSNAKLLREVLSKREDIDVAARDEFDLNKQLENALEIKMCKRGFTLRDFLYPTGPVNLYSSLKSTDRDAVDSFFKSTYSYKHFYKLKKFLKLQYANASQRPSLIAPAENAMRKLLGFHLPDLSVEVILMYLTNVDLKHMIAAVTIRSNTI